MAGSLRAFGAGVALGVAAAVVVALLPWPPPSTAAGAAVQIAGQLGDPPSAPAVPSSVLAAPAPDLPDVEPPPAEPVRLAFAGDVHGEGGVGAALARGGNPFAAIAPVLADADLTVVNLETAAAESGSPEDKSFTFNADPALLGSLSASGVDVISLANNHALDYGADALVETIQRAEAAGLQVVGAGVDAEAAFAPALFDIRGVRVAVVGMSRVLPTVDWFAGGGRPGIASAYDEAAAVAAVIRAAEVADRVVVAIHWGQELAACPDEVQLRLADALAAAGADVIAGHHPHVLQGIELRDQALVAYSLGNFAFHARAEDTSRTGVLRVTVAGESVAHDFFPARIEGSLPVPVTGDAADDVLGTVAARSPGGAAGCAFGPP